MSKRIPVIMLCLALVLALAVAPKASVDAASTTKSLSTNYTLVNLGTADAHVVVSYLLDNGTAWTAPAASTSFTIPANGGQKIVRQYQDTMTPPSGRGSATVSSDQPLGAVVQILARPPQVSTSGAYSGFSAGSGKFYVPLASRRGNSASGATNSQIIIMNTGSGATTVSVAFVGTTNFTKSGINIPAGASYYYDLDDETNLGTNWFGSATVQAGSGGSVAVVSNFFTGPDAMQTFNAFPDTSVGTAWVIPLFTSRLANTLSTPVAVQNLSGASIPAGGVTLSCTPDPGSSGLSAFSKSNTTAIANQASYYFNPVTDTSIPAAWYGSCRLNAGTKNVVSFVQMRYTANSNAAAYEAIKANGTNKKSFVPLISKRLTNGFATAVTIQNLSTSQGANVTLTYTPSPDYVAGGGSAAVLTTNTTIPANTSLIQNQRLSGFTVGSTAMPDGWYGTLSVASTNNVPIDGFVQLTNYLSPAGDTFMAHNNFSQP
jgi:hypothetical protein